MYVFFLTRCNQFHQNCGVQTVLIWSSLWREQYLFSMALALLDEKVLWTFWEQITSNSLQKPWKCFKRTKRLLNIAREQGYNYLSISYSTRYQVPYSIQQMMNQMSNFHYMTAVVLISFSASCLQRLPSAIEQIHVVMSSASYALASPKLVLYPSQSSPYVKWCEVLSSLQRPLLSSQKSLNFV